MVSGSALHFIAKSQGMFSFSADLPKDGPHITGEEKQYHQIGDEISLNCTSGKSYPASELQWFINDEQVTVLFLQEHKTTIILELI